MRRRAWGPVVTAAGLVAAGVGALGGAAPASAAARAFGPAEVRTIAVAGSAGVPEDGVAAVVVNLTATNVTAPTFVTAWPAGAPRPTTSNLNPRPGADTANLAVVPLDASGDVSVYNHAGRADVVIDVVGWIPAAGGAYDPAGTRLVDTRLTRTPLGPGAVRKVPVTAPAGATAVLNVTGVNATQPTFLTAWPEGPKPGTSNVNLVDGLATANLVLTAVGADGTVSIGNHVGSVDVVVDLLGTFGGAGLQSLAPTRLTDTRASGTKASPAQVPTVNGSQVAAVTGASGAGTLVANLTGVDATTKAFVTAWSGTGARPSTSNLNLPVGAALANLVVVPVAADADIHLFVSAGQANLVLDAAAWVPDGGAIRAVAPARVYDSRTADGPLAPPTRSVTYSVASRGTISADLEAFATAAQATYDDPRGWRAAGISFRRVATGGDFTLWLSQDVQVPSFGPPCTSTYSCRVGRNVIVNEARWRLATPVWNGAGASLADYRHLVVNHETGHWLGFDHLTCPGPGRQAPVMQQQSKGLNGCLPNPWPTTAELAVLGG